METEQPNSHENRPEQGVPPLRATSGARVNADVGTEMKYILLLVIGLTGCGPRWHTESITLPTGDVIKNRYRYSKGFLDTSYSGNWSIIWSSSGKEEPIPGYGGRLPSAEHWMMYTNSNIFGLTLGNGILWKELSGIEIPWRRAFVRGTPNIYDCIKAHLDRNYPHDYKANNYGTEVIAITSGISYASDYIYIQRQGGIPPYRLIDVDFDAFVLTLKRDRSTPFLPEYLILTNATFSADIESWSAKLMDNRSANKAFQAIGDKSPQPER